MSETDPSQKGLWSPGKRKQPMGLQEKLARAGRIWPQGQTNTLGWPHRSMMVSEKHKLLYMPVAKCACTSLKRTMVALSEVDQPDMVARMGVHLITDRFNTGAHLKDRPLEYGQAVLASDQYFKFGVIREPLQRLVSAYLDKFVYNRLEGNNAIHTEPVLKFVQGASGVDMARGISFDQFAEFILAQEARTLDPHWKPQHLYFSGVEHISRLFRLEQLPELQQELRRITGLKIDLQIRNSTRREGSLIEAASSYSAVDIDRAPPMDPASLLATPHLQALRQYYAEDIRLYDIHS